nr:phosphoenolpyruvate carboxykinase (GTP) [Candidatus Thorarchaeota archaeon]NIW15304.1 phosphoenolpyruvate carboxykinase (GTP) [Candidatus Thorarchaeota archaeon]NIW53269.1 phosphoenolpyruvate carboxykinase (GTP) [Candidatus Korarchaeota archaeon]
TNYFLKHEGEYTNEIMDKKVWILWAEGRVHNDYDVIKLPIGYIPEYDDLKDLFKLTFRKDYTEKEYITQFSLRLNRHLDKIERMEKIFGSEPDMPLEFWDIHDRLKNELSELKMSTGKSVLQPSYFE